ncbi:MAG TPA: GGDEF domain-containing protein [Edaphobacter sp.]|nr:GGDEF domain-containing protein [Edaphobacter sp.]
MDTHTLVVMNVLLYGLYAGVVIVNARITGTAGGMGWFVGANLGRGGALLLISLGGGLEGWPFTVAVGYLASVSGVMMLHFSFTELLERGPLLHKLQYALVGVAVVGTIVLSFTSWLYPAGLPLLCVVESIQIAATAWVVFLFSDRDGKLAGWLAGFSLMGYAVLILVRAVGMVWYGRSSPVIALQTTRWWLEGCLVVNSAITFGFMFLSGVRQRTELLWHAQVDELTGLLNRWALTRVAQKELSRSGRTKGLVAVAMMDLDGLKQVNDAHGHGCGDTVLQSVAQVLRSTVREQDSIARIGGDEFCILLPETKLDEALVVAERIRSEVEALSLQYRGETVRIRASMGVASSEICGLSLECLMDKSDVALYRAKRDGKNRVMVDEGTSVRTQQLET